MTLPQIDRSRAVSTNSREMTEMQDATVHLSVFFSGFKVVIHMVMI